jgi:hypothetical protein
LGQQQLDKALLTLVARMPKFVRRVLILSGPPVLSKLFEARGIESFDCRGGDRFPDGVVFDAIVGDSCDAIQDQLAQTIARLLPLLSPDGYVILAKKPAVPLDDAGIVPYALLNGPRGAQHGRKVPSPSVPTPSVFVGARPTYNPLTHARGIFDAGHPDWATKYLI